ncbi:MAG: IPT/TIG domain-containing protein, partial [Deltaproteobacteria bacterium]
MERTPRAAFWFAGVALAIVSAACTGNPFPAQDVPPADAIDAVSPPPDGPTDGAREAAAVVPILLAVQPDHGPFSGGTAVTLRGSNLRADLTVRFGDAQVQPRDMTLVDSHRLVVSAPSGIPGTVDVTIEDGTRRSRLPQAYTYDSFYADPTTGSIAGGTRITLHGQNTHWTAATTVVVDSSPCANLMFVGPNELSCSVPGHAQGGVPIIVSTGTDVITVGNAFTYYEASDPNNGGFGGGH